MAWAPDIGIQYNRNSSKDIISQPATLYADSTTLTTGMTLYDNTGTDTGYKVGTISGDSFDIQTETVTTYYAWKFNSAYNLANEPTAGAYSGNVYTTTETPDANSVIYNGVDSTIPFISLSGTTLTCGDTSNNYNTLFRCIRSSNDDITDLNSGNFLSNGPEIITET